MTAYCVVILGAPHKCPFYRYLYIKPEKDNEGNSIKKMCILMIIQHRLNINKQYVNLPNYFVAKISVIAGRHYIY